MHDEEAEDDGCNVGGHDVEEPPGVLLYHQPRHQRVQLLGAQAGEADQPRDLVVQPHHVLYPQHPRSEYGSRAWKIFDQIESS